MTSSNTVGYSKISLNEGYTCIAPAFFTPGQDTIELTAMEVVDGMDADNLSLLDSTGNTVACYYWFPAFEEAGTSFPAMWALDGMAGEEAVGITLDPGEAFLFYSNASSATLDVTAP